MDDREKREGGREGGREGKDVHSEPWEGQKEKPSKSLSPR
jgi:hypothetical protein